MLNGGFRSRNGPSEAPSYLAPDKIGFERRMHALDKSVISLDDREEMEVLVKSCIDQLKDVPRKQPLT